MKKKPKMAAELMAELRSNPDFVAQEQQREERRLRQSAETRRAFAPVVAELIGLGFDIKSIGELPRKELSYERAVPVLMKWLPLVSDSRAKEAIVRALSVPFAKAAAVLLIEEFRKAGPDLALKWAIGNALDVLASDDVVQGLLKLVQDKEHGKAREMLVLALGKLSNQAAVDVLIGLLDDDEVAGHAIMSLGKLKAQTAREPIERFLDHPKPWVRAEARKALARIRLLPRR